MNTSKSFQNQVTSIGKMESLSAWKIFDIEQYLQYSMLVSKRLLFQYLKQRKTDNAHISDRGCKNQSDGYQIESWFESSWRFISIINVKDIWIMSTKNTENIQDFEYSFKACLWKDFDDWSDRGRKAIENSIFTKQYLYTLQLYNPRYKDKATITL